ncbi:MAG TPA: alpha/beta hydrolase [Thermoanaerobaculia bacterium]|jgi:proline iminopeptidase|nr:alpha/beta hydrolase [Thermoanaerobaculia bacterium]
METSEGCVTGGGPRLFFRTSSRGRAGGEADGGERTLVVPNGWYLLDELAPLQARGRRIVVYDPRHRGRSDAVEDPAELARGIDADVDDLERVREHFGLARFDLLGHSYAGMMVALYALRHGERVGRMVQVGPMEPFPGKEYPPHLTGATMDGVLREVFAKIAELQAASEPSDPVERCRGFWAELRRIYVTDPAHAHRAEWGRCELPLERNFMRYWMGQMMPSLRALALAAEQLAAVRTPTLVVHGTRDRSAPYGGAREWAMLLGDARLVTVEGAGHAPWIEAPELVLGAIAAFLDGDWPTAAETVRA